MFFGLPGATAISCLFLVSADANTSAGAPWVIWVTRALEPAKLYVNVRPELAAVSFVLAALNAPVSDAAANTLSEPVSAAAVVGGAPVVDVFAVDVLVDELDEQAPSNRANTATIGATLRRARVGMNRTSSHCCGISTTTLVDFTEATANTPGASLSSSAASRLMSETTRY